MKYPFGFIPLFTQILRTRLYREQTGYFREYEKKFSYDIAYETNRFGHHQQEMEFLMFKDSFKELSQNKIDILVDIINPFLKVSPFIPNETKAISHSLPFYPAQQFVEIRKANASPPFKLNCITPLDHKKWNIDQIAFLDGSNKSIYRLNKELPIALNESNIHTYVLFFFTHVRGAQGQFQILMSIDDINWHDAPSPSGVKALSKMINPLTIIDKNDDGYLLKSTILFKDSLFESDILVKENGMITLSNQKILVEDLPVIDSILST